MDQPLGTESYWQTAVQAQLVGSVAAVVQVPPWDHSQTQGDLGVAVLVKLEARQYWALV